MASSVSFARRLPAGCVSVCAVIVAGLVVVRTKQVYKSNRMPSRRIFANKSGIRIAFPMSAAKRGRTDYATRAEEYMAKDLEQRGLENQVKGSAKEMEGKVRGNVGDATDNTSEHIKGRAKELEGKIQKNFGKGERDIDENT
jgi:uncharacterized protein YjbJ (UPF0337 family)